MRNKLCVLHNPRPGRNSHCGRRALLSRRAKALSMQKNTENLKQINGQELRDLLPNKKKLNLPWKLSQMPLLAVEIGKMARPRSTRSWPSPGLWLTCFSRALRSWEDPASSFTPAPAALFSGGHTAAREQLPHGSVPGLLCLLCQGRLLLPWGPRVSAHVKWFLSTDICGTGAPAPGELLEQIYF